MKSLPPQTDEKQNECEEITTTKTTPKNYGVSEKGHKKERQRKKKFKALVDKAMLAIYTGQK